MEFLLTEEGLPYLLAALVAIGELLALSPLKSNSIFQLALNILKTLKEKNVDATGDGAKKHDGYARLPLVLLLAFSMAIATMLASCAAIPTPEGPGEALAIAQTSYTTALVAATKARNAGYVDDDLAAQLTESFDRVELLLNAAHDAYAAGDLETLGGKLELVSKLLKEVEEVLPNGV